MFHKWIWEGWRRYGESNKGANSLPSSVSAARRMSKQTKIFAFRIRLSSWASVRPTSSKDYLAICGRDSTCSMSRATHLSAPAIATSIIAQFNCPVQRLLAMVICCHPFQNCAAKCKLPEPPRMTRVQLHCSGGRFGDLGPSRLPATFRSERKMQCDQQTNSHSRSTKSKPSHRDPGIVRSASLPLCRTSFMHHLVTIRAAVCCRFAAPSFHNISGAQKH